MTDGRLTDDLNSPVKLGRLGNKILFLMCHFQVVFLCFRLSLKLTINKFSEKIADDVIRTGFTGI